MEEIIAKVVSTLEEKNGEDIVTLDLKNKGGLADAFVIVTGNSETHMKTLTEAVEETLEREGRTCRIEGEHSVNWRLIDSGDIVVHVFSHRGREFYRLERLWEE